MLLQKKELVKEDFEKLKVLSEEDDYEMLTSFFYRMTMGGNADKLRGFNIYIREFLDDISYVEFLINSGLIEEAEKIIESRDSDLYEESRFRLYLMINREKAIDFAYKKKFYTSLIRYYYEIGEYDKVIHLFIEAVEAEKKVEEDIYRVVFDSTDKGLLAIDEKKKVLHTLFERCYSQEYYNLCVDIGIKIGDKELLYRLIEENIGYHYSVESKLRLLMYLSEDYSKEVKRELEELTEELIEEKNNYAYEKAVDCILLLWKMMSEEKWEMYVKKIYERHWRKINLWREFKNRGVTVKRIDGVIRIQLEKGFEGNQKNLEENLGSI